MPSHVGIYHRFNFSSTTEHGQRYCFIISIRSSFHRQTIQGEETCYVVEKARNVMDCRRVATPGRTHARSSK